VCYGRISRYAPVEEEGAYRFANVGRSVRPSVRRKTKWLPTIILKLIYHRAFIFHMLIGLSEDKNPIDIGFTRSKVTMVTFVKKNVFHSLF